MTVNGAAEFQQLVGQFSDAAAQYAAAREGTLFEKLRNLRLNIAAALLDLPAAALQASLASITQFAVACVTTGIRAFPRSAAENALFVHCLAGLTPWQPDLAPTQGLAALVLAHHAFELKFIPPIASLPAETRSLWLQFLCEMPPGFINIGDAEKFALYLPNLCRRIAECLNDGADLADDALEAFGRSAVFFQSYFNEANLRDTMRMRGAIIEHSLERGGATLDALRVTRPIPPRARIGFICLGLADNTETVFLAAHMEHLDHDRYDIRLYSFKEPSGKVGARCQDWADTYLRLPENIDEAVKRLREEDLDLCIFCTNMTGSSHQLTKLAAHRMSRIQASTIASPISTGLRNMDVMISGAANETADSHLHYTERLLCLPGALNCYPFHYMLAGLPDPGVISRASLGVPQNCILFFSAANFYKIVPDLSEDWFKILAQVPDSHLLLMPFGPNWGGYNPDAFATRLTQQLVKAGVSPPRVHFQGAVPTIAHLHKIIAVADVYLDAFPFSGACSLYDPLLMGVPVVTRAGGVCRSRHSKAMLEELGLAHWVAWDSASYVRAAVELAFDADKRAAQQECLSKARASRWPLDDTAGYAAKLMPVLDGLFSDWNERVHGLRASDGAEVSGRIASLAGEAAKRFSSFTDRDLIVSLVVPYLRHGGSKRMMDVGACLGVMTMPFLGEGWQAVMFEPDTRCYARLTALSDAYGGRARVEISAVTAGLQGSVAFHVAGLPGLSGLSTSPYAPDISTVEVPAIALTPYILRKDWRDVDFIKIDAEGHDIEILRSIDFKIVSPRLVMVEFGDHFAGQDRANISVALTDMRMRGYRACVFCLHALGQFERHEWGTRLLAVGADEVPALAPEERLFGNILFFRETDRDFLPSVIDWLEQVIKWH